MGTKKPPPEPGTLDDLEHGLPGNAEEMPFNDADEEFETGINDDEPEEDDE